MIQDRLLFEQLWVASTFFYLFVFIVCEFVKYVVKKTSLADDHFLRVFILELVGTLEVAVPMFDVDFILSTYGLLGLFLEILILEYAVWKVVTDAYTNPCYFFSPSAIKELRLRNLLSVTLAQAAAIPLTSLFAKTFWRFGFHNDHLDALRDEFCDSDLTVSLTHGFLIEAGATFCCRFMELLTDEYMDSNDAILNSAAASLITVFGIYHTGVYCNPVVAAACMWGCRGASHWDHLGVFWLGPFIGWGAAEAAIVIAKKQNAQVEKNHDK